MVSKVTGETKTNSTICTKFTLYAGCKNLDENSLFQLDSLWPYKNSKTSCIYLDTFKKNLARAVSKQRKQKGKTAQKRNRNEVSPAWQAMTKYMCQSRAAQSILNYWDFSFHPIVRWCWHQHPSFRSQLEPFPACFGWKLPNILIRSGRHYRSLSCRSLILRNVAATGDTTQLRCTTLIKACYYRLQTLSGFWDLALSNTQPILPSRALHRFVMFHKEPLSGHNDTNLKENPKTKLNCHWSIKNPSVNSPYL